MCGIVGYIGTQAATGILLAGLEKLEYRGYDSAGIATVLEGNIHCVEQRKTPQPARKARTDRKPSPSWHWTHSLGNSW